MRDEGGVIVYVLKRLMTMVVTIWLIACKLSLYFGIKEAFFCTFLQKALSPFLKECAKFFVN
ncbi:putative membrane protein, partial [Geobacillus sp. PA-3]